MPAQSQIEVLRAIGRSDVFLEQAFRHLDRCFISFPWQQFAWSSFLASQGTIAESWEMILGLGIDIIEVARIESSYERFGEKFVRRILLPGEISYCCLHKKAGPFLAVRFAAKEAISKAFGTGICARLGWQDMEVCRKESGEPFVVLHGKGKQLFEERGAKQLLISLSHTENYATAVAILEA